jgi:hypothetical protein
MHSPSEAVGAQNEPPKRSLTIHFTFILTPIAPCQCWRKFSIIQLQHQKRAEICILLPLGFSMTKSDLPADHSHSLHISSLLPWPRQLYGPPDMRRPCRALSDVASSGFVSKQLPYQEGNDRICAKLRSEALTSNAACWEWVIDSSPVWNDDR